MSGLLTFALFIGALLVGAWIFLVGGRQLTNNRPYFRDMSYGTAFGFVFGAVLIYWVVSTYIQSSLAEGPEANRYFFFRVAVHGLIAFSVVAYFFRMLGQSFGSEGSKKLFRDMPLTAAFGVVTIMAYAFVALFAGQISVSVIVIIGIVGIIASEFVRFSGGTRAANGIASAFGIAMAIMVIMFFVGPIAPYGQEEVLAAANIVPGGDPAVNGDPDFPLGTDQIGRDILSRLIYGAQNTVGIAFATTCLAFFLGGTFGFLAAALGGWLDNILSRIVDVLMAIPALIFALLLMTIATVWAPQLGIPLTLFMVVIIAVIDSTRVFRLARAVGQNIVVMDYIEAAKLRGEGLGYLMFKEILPNATAPLLAEFGLRFCFVFLTIASLSFLGVGIQPPLADWGTMVRDLAQFINFAAFAPQVATAPLLAAGAIALLTVAVNFVVDWMLHKSSGLKE